MTFLRWIIMTTVLLGLGGCVSMATQQLAGSLAEGIVNQDDPETVRAGAPAYLLMVDGLINDAPDNETLLLAGARLYGAYAAVFVDDKTRAQRMAAKARDYARRALCLRKSLLCDKEQGPYEQFAPVLVQYQETDLPVLHAYGVAWLGWISAASGDWSAVADLPKVEAVLRRVLVLDDAYQRGQPHLLLGILATLRPPAFGGRPEVGRTHFERAIKLSDGQDLMMKVEFARRYARLVFDRELHDRLLNEVLAASPQVPGYTLSNVLAQQEARRLLQSADDYF